MRLHGARIDLNAIGFKKGDRLRRVLSGASIEADLLHYHDSVPISTHQTLEDVESIDTANRRGSDLALIVDRDHLSRELGRG